MRRSAILAMLVAIVGDSQDDAVERIVRKLLAER
jgi:hypothetical protein